MTVTKWNGNAIVAKVRQASARGVMRGSELVLQTAVDKIMGPPKTGVVYGGHQASAPGEAPANYSGELANSGYVNYDLENATGNVIFTSPHAGWMEFGNEKVEARPFLRPALHESLKSIRDMVGGEIRRSLK